VNNRKNGEGIYLDIHIPNHTRIPNQVGGRKNSRIIPRPLMHQFLGNQQMENQGPQVLGETFQYYLRECRALGDNL
jgi:hypothetical protein